jgi:rod shape-determining protein MreC
MESFFYRYRNVLVLLAVLLAQIIGLAVQVRRSVSGSSLEAHDGASVRLLRYWAESIVAPPERLFADVKQGAFVLWQNYLDLRHVRDENQQLEHTINRLRLEQAQLLEDARQGQRLQAMLGFQENYIYKTVAAQAIGTSGTDHSRVFYLDKGSDAGLSTDNAVITPDGIVGKVREVFPHSAQVLAINDQTSGAGVILEATRIRGILRGDARGRVQIVGLLSDQRIQPGEKVLTAGGDQIFPRGLPVGVVDHVEHDPDRDGFIDVIIRPAAQLNRLDEVLVITGVQARFSQDQQQDMAQSEAEKGAEVTAVKDQIKASAIMSEHLPGLTDPNLPADQQPQPSPLGGNPGPPSHPGTPLHPDRFSPAGVYKFSSASTTSETKPDSTAPVKKPATGASAKTPASRAAKPAGASPAKPASKPSATRRDE